MPLFERDGNWHYHFEIAGKRYRKSTRTTDKKKAERIESLAFASALKAHQGKEDEEEVKPKRAPVLRDFSPRFLEFVKNSRLANQSKRDYKNGWNLIRKTKIAGMRMDRITRDDVETTRFHKSPYSTNAAIRTLRRMLHKAQEWKVLKDVPKINTVYAPGRNMVFTAASEANILARSPQPLNDFLQLVLDCGFRDMEALEMKVQYIHWEHAYYANAEGKTERARRRVPLSDRVLALLKRRCHGRLHGWVFTSDLSRSGHVELQRIQMKFRKICRDLGYPDELKIYCGRHTYGSDVMSGTGNPYLVGESMGHADLETTKPYMHQDVAHAKKAIDQRNAVNARIVASIN